MFYVKTKLNDDSVLEVDITRDNVFCRCPLCGAEVQINLEDDYIGDKDFSVQNSEVACEKCSRKVLAGDRK